ncbi:Farnesyl diphosphate synthase [Serratia symbiotica]|nr:Farnesyl diphosphate synthase [Serratia symbiotica]
MLKIIQSINFFDTFTEFQKRINNVLLKFMMSLPCNENNLISAMRYSTLFSGKRFRPLLVYIIGQMFDISKNNLDAPAAAIECIHAYSLIHDDLPSMDNNNLRRGKETCHIKFGEANAILAGDALQTLAFSILSNAIMPNVVLDDRLLMISILAKASGISGMCLGQFMDLNCLNKKIDIKKLEQIYNYKTGSLISAAVHLGTLSAGESGRIILPILNRYASAIGLAFQIQDDILDIIGKSKKTGKYQGLDKQSKKNTYPILLGIENSKKRIMELYYEALDALDILTNQSYNTILLKELANFIIKRDN